LLVDGCWVLDAGRRGYQVPLLGGARGGFCWFQVPGSRFKVQDLNQSMPK